ncbi:hypothetical protein Patl1_11392 [Pistacia atlantica]|uniref:Uncharacterized protein n=1 Tax=Pistacia atlantica TaxID=434234 RepID=A0ACC1A4M8_9ROSI|nr:hypothetical protein Patl1_11392 [Pistacia atlantica]
MGSFRLFKGTLHPFYFTRRANGENDITLKILYCGICRTDLYTVNNTYGVSLYPVLPGHEIVGEVIQVGAKVQNFKVGDKAGVGCFIGSCGSCDGCQNDLESYCPKSITTYTIFDNGGDKNYGITVFSPMKFFGLDKAGMHVGVVGLGGLGHLAIKFGKAFGMKMSVISTSPSKTIEAIEQLKADSFVVSHDMEQMEVIRCCGYTLDGIIATISPTQSLLPLLNLLKLNGKLILLTPPDLHKPIEIPVMPLFSGRRTISAGGMKETQEMIDFAAKHNITANVEVISMDYVIKAMDRLAKGDVRYRFVIDAQSLAPKQLYPSK